MNSAVSLSLALVAVAGFAFAGAGAAAPGASSGTIVTSQLATGPSLLGGDVWTSHCSNPGQHNPPQPGGPKENCKKPNE